MARGQPIALTVMLSLSLCLIVKAVLEHVAILNILKCKTLHCYENGEGFYYWPRWKRSK